MAARIYQPARTAMQSGSAKAKGWVLEFGSASAPIRVTGSSGFAALDQIACAKVTARARFDPATDDTGAKVAGRYATTIRWEIPD